MPANDLSIYERHGASWWDDADRTFASLRSIGRFRVGTLARWLDADPATLRVVDLGCGGGLLAIPLAQSGARVIGVDGSARSLRAAARAAPRRCGFVQADLTRAPLTDGCADLVLLGDVLEHLEAPAAAVRQAARLLVPGGALFVSTLNRTRRAALLAVTVAEGLSLIPKGTHDARLFLAPASLDAMASGCGLRRTRLQGESVALWRTVRRWAIALKPGRSVAVSYSALYRKEPDSTESAPAERRGNRDDLPGRRQIGGDACDA